MKTKKTGRTAPRRVAIAIEMDWGFKRHLEVYSGCQRYADEAGWDCRIQPADQALATSSGRPPFDGVIARATPALAAAARKHGIPVVNVWVNSPVKNELPGVHADHRAAGAMAAEHLLGRGFRQFAYLGFQNDIDSRQQADGFREALRQAGYPCTTHRFSRTSIEAKARGWKKFTQGLREWIETWRPPVGVYVCNDLICRYLIDVCRSMGLHVSEDVAIVGTSNETDICIAPQPTLTSIDLGYGQIGYRAAALLDQLMDGKEPSTEPEFVLPPELVPRQSTDVYAADDPMVAQALRFIAENSHGRMQVHDVIAAVATNRRTLERKFRDSVGRSIAGEITRLRLDRAKRRMVETDVPMKDVAIDAGFRNADHFYKVFARVEGISPTDYRKLRSKVFPEPKAD